jgi:hypothetical protein
MIPATTMATSAHQGAFCGIPPERTTRRSTGASSGSIAWREKRAIGLKGLMRLVRTSQSRTAITAATAASTKNARRRKASVAS